ncbi:MAG: hypothetical protein IJ741_07720, partial [Schwartzia sp.]|nr:hypothetical protein [Schwartzia sp. (in: firmicutes)]
MYLRFAHVYIIGIWQVGFRFAGIKVSFLPESRFPFRRIHGFPAPEYSPEDSDLAEDIIDALHELDEQRSEYE